MRVRLHDETGMMGKLVIVWVLLFTLAGVAAVDTVSIMFATLHVADVGGKAANAGVDAFSRTGNARTACDEAAAFVRDADDAIKIPKSGFCTVNVQSGSVTITIKKTARTLLAGRLRFTKHYAQVVYTETAGLSAV